MGDVGVPPNTAITRPARTVYPVHHDDNGPVIDVDHLVVGAGPAGASMGAFLGQHGLKGLIISAAPSTAHTPRAHVTNPAAFECLRDIGIDRETYSAAQTGDKIMHVRFCSTFLGREYGRTYAWGGNHQDKFREFSPCHHADIPQTLLEPIILRYAAQHGFPYRFSTELLHFEDKGDNGVLATVRDRITTSTYKIKAKYMYGADGARSRVVSQLQLPISSQPGLGDAYNVIFRADVTDYMKDRLGNLHVIMRPDADFPDHAWMGIMRMIKPWYEWMVVVFAKPGWTPATPPTKEMYLDPIKKWIGNDTIDVEVLRVDKWEIHEDCADMYSKGDVFCLGDACHRHPPSHGLGSNTCIQDAYNLAWKVAFVEKGLASPSILSTYSTERAPVGAQVVKQSNASLRTHMDVWPAAGMLEPTVEARMAAVAELEAPTAAGAARRKLLAAAILTKEEEFQALGLEVNQRYNSCAVYQADEEEGWPPLPKDPLGDFEPITYPGARFPHVWLNSQIPGTRISTQDLAGKGRFSLFTGIVGDKTWKIAAEKVKETLGVEVKVFVISIGGEWVSQYGDWERINGIDESGCVLVRPDRFVAWRAKVMVEDATMKLEEVMRALLGR